MNHIIHLTQVTELQIVGADDHTDGMKPRTVEVTPIPRGHAALLRVGMWSLAISGEELALLIVAALDAARVLRLPGPWDSDTI